MKERVMRVAIAPWTLTPRIAKLTSVDLVETPPCLERSLEHMVDGSHHTNPR
jgi:hypothetical protein